MPSHKRPKAILSSDSESQSDSDLPSNHSEAPETGSSSSKRVRRATNKAAAAAEDEKAKKQLTEYRKLKSQVKALKKQLTQQKSAESHDDTPDDNQSDPDRLPPESEEENEVTLGLAASVSAQDDAHHPFTEMRAGMVEIRRISTVTSKPAEQANRPRIRRRVGSESRDKAPEPASESGGGNTSNTNDRVAAVQAPSHPASTQDSRASPSAAPLPISVPSRPDSAPASQMNTAHSAGTPAPTAADLPTSRSAPFRGGVAPLSGARPKVEDYTDEVKELLLDSIKHFSCYIYTKNAFPSDTQQDAFATDAWKTACNTREESVPYDLSDRMKRIIWARKSNARGDASDEVRSHTANAYGFRDGATTSNQRHNLALYTKLIKDGAFHHKTFNESTGKPEGFAGHPYISRVIHLAFFGNTRTAIGFRFPDAFNPIPTPTVAFVLTVIRAHIEEWSTGRHSMVHFSESEFATTYKGLLEDLKGWVEGKDDMWLNIRKKWYRRAFTAGGGVMAETGNGRVSKSVLDSAREELEGRTGLTDSEDEGAGEGSS